MTTRWFSTHYWACTVAASLDQLDLIAIRWKFVEIYREIHTADPKVLH